MTERELLLSGLEQLGLPASPQAVDDLLRFSALLLEKNKVMNLTAVTDPREVVTRHFLDCAALAPQLQPGGRVLDVGTGAGFPGLPLAVLCPQTEFTLLDAQRKRIDFLSDVIAALGLSNCTAVHARAEDFAKDNRAAFDCAVSRAVAELRVLAELSLPMVRVRLLPRDEGRGLRGRGRGRGARLRGARRGSGADAVLHRAARRGRARAGAHPQNRGHAGAVPAAVQKDPVCAAVSASAAFYYPLYAKYRGYFLSENRRKCVFFRWK